MFAQIDEVLFSSYEPVGLALLTDLQQFLDVFCFVGMMVMVNRLGREFDSRRP